MKLIIIAIVILSFAACSSDKQSKVNKRPKTDSLVEKSDYQYQGISQGFKLDKYNEYNSTFCFGTLAGRDTILLEGAWYISSRGKNKLFMKFNNDQEVKIISAKKIFVEDINALQRIRITNYKGIITILDHNKKINLKPNETILIDRKGYFNKFYNEDALSDTTWLTGPLVRLEKENLCTVISRVADRYACQVHFNVLCDALSIWSISGSIDTGHNSLEDCLKMLQTVVEDNLKFSYVIKDHVVYIDKKKM